jgi:hypothetical protein
VVGKPWSSSILKAHIATLASKCQLCIEKEANKQNEVATNMLRQHQHEATSYGINDDSGHWYDEGVYWDEENVARDGQPRYDTLHEAYGMYGNPSLADREFDETYQNIKGKGGKAKGKG